MKYDTIDLFYSIFRYILDMLAYQDSWVIFKRAGVLLRSHHTNNFSESMMCIIKDVILNR